MTSGGATCLRCDWSGDGRANSPCPRCGAPLFSAQPLDARPRAGFTSRVRKSRASPPVEPDEEPEPRRRRAVGPVVFAAISLGAALVLILSQGHHPARPESASRKGVLIYSISLQQGTSQLYRWDLSTGKVTPGPKISGLDGLWSTSKFGWIGVSRFLPSGQMQASVMRTDDLSKAPVPLLSGRFVAFDATGTSAVSVHERAATSGCNNRIGVDVREIAVGVGQQQFESRSCWYAASIARSSGTTYLSLINGTKLAIDFIGYRVLHQILGGHKLESVSSASDMLVVPSQGVSARLFFRGTGALDPIPIAIGGQPLQLSFVLAWSPNASTTLVVGQVGQQVGIYQVEVGPGVSPRVPTFVTAVSDRAWASYGSDGTAYVVSGGRMFTIGDHGVSPLAMPAGAPGPFGPVIWLPA